MDKNFLNDLSKLQEKNADLLNKLFKINDLVFDGELVIYHASDSFKQILSINSASVIGQCFSQFINNKDSNHLLSLLSNHKNQTININLLFPLGNNDNIVYEMVFEQVVIEDSSWLILKDYNAVEISISKNDVFFEKNALPQLIIEPNTLQVIATNQAANEILPNSIIRQRNIQLYQLVNLPPKKFNAIFNNDLSNGLPAPLSIPLFVTDGQTEHVPIKLSKIDYQGKIVWLIEVLSHGDYDDDVDSNIEYYELKNALFESKDYALLMIDSFGVISEINQIMCKLLNVERTKAIGQRAKMVLPSQITTLISTSENSQHQVNLLETNQAFNLHQKPLRNQQGYVLGLLLELRTIIDKEKGLIARAYEAINNAGSHAVFIIDNQGFIIYVNDIFEYQTGYRKSTIIGEKFSVLKSSDVDNNIFQNLWQTVNSKNIWRGILKHQRASGVSYWSDLTVKPLLDRAGNIECFVGLSHDITLQKENEKSGTYLANYDVTTGLANCILAKDRLDGMLGRAHRRKLFVAVIYLDITQLNVLYKDNNKDTADNILLIYCKHLQQALRAEDTIARMSRDRLAIFLPDLAHAEALNVVSAKIDKVNQYPITYDNSTFSFDIRQGVSYFPDQGLDSDSLLKNAEAAVIKAWSTGAAIGYFSKEKNENAVMHFNLRREIDNLIANKSFDIIYQPIISLVDNSLYCVEAQVVWNHELYGLIDNDDLYAVAEASGCIQELGYLVLEQVCVDIQYWSNSDVSDIHVSVNLSHGQLRDKSVPHQFSELLTRYKIKNECIGLEIPLSYIATQWLNLDDIFQQFSLLGFSLHYDKFGDRGAYISDLKNFPFKGLKLTTDYISLISEDVNTANLVEGLVLMAKSLNLEITAVGVTELSQVLQLQEIGCKYAQGDFLSEFVNRDGIVQFIKKGMTI